MEYSSLRAALKQVEVCQKICIRIGLEGASGLGGLPEAWGSEAYAWPFSSLCLSVNFEGSQESSRVVFKKLYLNLLPKRSYVLVCVSYFEATLDSVQGAIRVSVLRSDS